MAGLDMGPFNRGRHVVTDHTRSNIERPATEVREKGITPELELFNGGHLNEARRLIDEGFFESRTTSTSSSGPGRSRSPTRGTCSTWSRTCPREPSSTSPASLATGSR